MRGARCVWATSSRRMQRSISAGGLPIRNGPCHHDGPPHSWPSRDVASEDGERRRDALATACERCPSARRVGAVLEAMLRDAHLSDAPPHIPALLDERQCPLDGDDSADDGAKPAAAAPVRFVWHDGGDDPRAALPRTIDAVELACFVFTRLRMDTIDAVVAMTLVHALVAHQGPIVRAHSARPIFVAACVLARKLGTDADITTPECSAAMDDNFNNLSALLLARIQEQLLELLHWRVPLDAKVYESCAQALGVDLA